MRFPHNTLRRIFLLAFVLISVEVRGQAQIYVDSGSPYSGISDYSLSGTALNTPLISENFPAAMALSGNLLYAEYEPLGANSETISVYNATTGTVIQNALITGSTGNQLVASGGNLYASTNGGGIDIFNAVSGQYMADAVSGVYIDAFAVGGNTIYGIEQSSPASSTYSIYTFNATTGALLSGSPLVSGLYGASSSRPVVSGNFLYVESQGPVVNGFYSAGSIGVYNATTGMAINSSLITGLDDPTKLVLSGGDLYVADVNAQDQEILQEFSTSGTSINPDVIPGGLGEVLDVEIIPEPSITYMLFLGLGCIAFWRLRRHSHQK